MESTSEATPAVSSQRGAHRATTTVEVEIFGSVFNVRSASDEEHLQRLARFVDGKMKEIAAHTTAVDTTKIAVLAALNIADQLVREAGSLGSEREIEERLGKLADRLHSALES
ncbi:MAG: cell division protein ZapA [Acidobacteria bacterium]|nr:MAG: cell division protein ZapA [Acidobacteriota bacterium]REK10168.1 MAG: cell division protein ZapA [Acidobacteriota bacterium]